jgi:hypothetical protein
MRHGTRLFDGRFFEKHNAADWVCFDLVTFGESDLANKLDDPIGAV